MTEGEDRLRAIFDNVFSAIITIDDRGVIQSVNKAAEQLFGYAADELLGQNVKMLMPSPHREEHDGYLRRFHETGVKRIIGTNRELQAVRKDGTLIDVALSVSQVNHQGLFTGVLLDITRRKELEREVVEIATLEQQRIDQDLHDGVGQELTALGLLADSLVETLRDESPANVAVAEMIERRIRGTLLQVRGIAHGLAVGEIDSEGLPLALAEMAGRLPETSEVRVTCNAAPPAPAFSTLEATHLCHIAQEASTNALKHARATAIEVELRTTRHEVTLSVRDDGVGIGDAREGLGMRIMRNRAKLIGARLILKTANPHGTTVTCTLDRSRSNGE